MSFGGSTAAANQSIKANHALARGRDHLFDRNVKYKAREGKQYAPPTASPAVRKKNQQAFAAEQVRERWVWVGCVTVGIVIGAYLCFLCYRHLLLH